MRSFQKFGSVTSQPRAVPVFIYDWHDGIMYLLLVTMSPFSHTSSVMSPPLFKPGAYTFLFLKKHSLSNGQGANSRSHRSLRPPPLAESTLWHLQLFCWIWVCCHSEQSRISDRCILSHRVSGQGECGYESLPHLPELFCQRWDVSDWS